MMEDVENQEQKEGGSAAGSSRKVLPSHDNELEDVRTKREKDLWYWNLGCCLLHLVQAIVCLASGLSEGSKAAEFKLPLTTLFLVWTEEYPDGPRYPSQKLNQVGLLPFTAVTSIFSWLSSAAHLIVLLNFDMYIKDLRRGINQFRWYEYALSSSLMIGLIAALFGMYDVISLVLIMSVNACMNLFGYNMENNSDIKNKKIDWISFGFGCFAGVVPWCCVLAYVGGSPDVSNIPEFVWGILVTYFIMFLTFPLNMCLQYFGVSYWSDSYQGHSMGGYMFGEKVYQILSLVAKSLLLWLVYGGTNQPNSYTSESA